MGEFFEEEDPTIFEDVQEDEVFDRQMALREVAKDFEKSDEYFKRISSTVIVTVLPFSKFLF